MEQFSAIPTYVINLKDRIDRKVHIVEEFRGRSEFSVSIMDAFKHNNGAVGLWLTIKNNTRLR